VLEQHHRTSPASGVAICDAQPRGGLHAQVRQVGIGGPPQFPSSVGKLAPRRSCPSEKLSALDTDPAPAREHRSIV